MVKKKYGGEIYNAEIHLKPDYSGTYKEAFVVFNPIDKEKNTFLVSGVLKEDMKNRFIDGESISTSLVVDLSKNRVETLNTVYDIKSWRSEFYREIVGMNLNGG